jgi:thioester reductase-like protein
MPRLIFLTGFPGFIGRRLVRGLLAADSDARTVALVEEKQLGRARELAAGIDAERIEVLSGNIAEPGLGLETEALERLRTEVTEVFHLAAIYNLAVPLEIAQRVNVDGTGNVLEFCARCSELRRLNYISTAYVAGDRRGVVYEHELVFGQGFKNHYESTKFQAELWVRERMGEIPTTIFRPAIVVGDSQTGETEKFDGPYYMLRTIARSAQRNSPLPQLGNPGSPFNVVPVDFIVRALAAVGLDEESTGQTLHLVDPEPVSAAELARQLALAYAGREPSLRVPAPLLTQSLRVRRVREYFGGAPHESIRYLNHPVRFDTRAATAALERHGLSCPPFAEYVGPMVDFFRAHEDDSAYVPPAA